ncbi:MAG TPA: putative LPS assembly protein LptD [Chitinophagales bacterium]|nr:putative LPS assembly protein LptD [Chitinophagales bacterium]
MFYIFLLLLGWGCLPLMAQQPDAAMLPADTLKPVSPPDSAFSVVDTIGIKFASGAIKEKVTYSAKDSIIYDITNQKIYLYNKAKISQGSMTIKAGEIALDYTQKIIKALPYTDTTGVQYDVPLFSDAEREFQSDIIVYNFETKKGRLTQLVTQEGDGYLRGEVVKKNEYDEMFGRNAFYTTCNHEHPHFKINVNRVKIIPNKLIVSGPAQLIIEDVPTPVFLPFGIFPLTKGQRSGILLPAYGYSPNRGFYFQGGGYYLGLSDVADIALTTDIFTNGSWRAALSSDYRKKYKVNGNINIDYGINKDGDPITPSYTERRNFFVRWNHAQDAKARPNSNFSANVGFGSSGFNREFEVRNNNVLTNTLTSSVNYNFSIPGTPLRVALNSRLDQNTNTQQINVSLPNLRVDMNRQFPFARKVQTGGARWYEKIGVAYNMRAEARTNVTDSLLFTRTFFDNMRYGLEHNVATSTNFNLFKYINISPSVNYSEAWYFRTVEKQWVPDTTYQMVVKPNGESVIDTILPRLQTIDLNGFKRAVKQLNTGVSATTKLFGFVNFKKGKIKAIRHEVTPSVSFNYQPNFGADFWNYYRFVQNNVKGDSVRYSVFEGAIFGAPSSGAVGSVGMSLNNNLQMKLLSAKDTVNNGEKKINLIDRLNFNTSYNMLADSMRWAPINFNGGVTFARKVQVNLSGAFDPYTIDDNGRSINQTHFKATGAPLRFSSLSFTVATSITADELKKMVSGQGTEQEREELKNNPDAFVYFNIPWRLSLDYNLSLRPTRRNGRDTTLVTQSLNFNGELNLSPKWRIAANSGYDFAFKRLSRTTLDIYRDLHCWEMVLTLAPTGQYRYYVFTIRVKSALLQDLKINRRRFWQDLN